MSDKKIYSLVSVSKAIKQALDDKSRNDFWVRAEIVNLNYYARSGHCYPELVEKQNGKVVAEIRANIWNTNFSQINDKFRAVLKEELKDNITVVILGRVTYHATFGLSFNIIDIDPSYTLGDIARQKNETIDRLKQESLYSLNKQKHLPKIPKNIAIISIDTSKGYNDFISVLQSNSWGYQFNHLLFPAILQGDNAVITITQQLNKIASYGNIFDAVAIVRGGGGEVGLSCYDNYQLAKTVASFPIPVLSGIGHSTNETVTEMVSYKSFITPTEMGEFILQQYHNFSVPLQNFEKTISVYSSNLLKHENNRLNEEVRVFAPLVQKVIDEQTNILERSTSKTIQLTNDILRTEKQALTNHAYYIREESSKLINSQNQALEKAISGIGNYSNIALSNNKKSLKQSTNLIATSANSILNLAKKEVSFTQSKVNILDPKNVLKRGFSIARVNGKALHSTKQISESDTIETQLYDGSVISVVEQLKHSQE